VARAALPARAAGGGTAARPRQHNGRAQAGGASYFEGYMRTVKWKELESSDAARCDECNQPFVGGEVRLLAEFANGQVVIHRDCKSRWEKRTGSIDAENQR
jgi:hypothetical protein